MSRGVLPRHCFRIDALSIVADHDSQLPSLVIDRYRRAPRLRVLDHVPQRLPRDPVRFVADRRIQVA